MVNFFIGSKAIINTLVRLMPIALYSGSAMASLIFSDFKGIILLGGFIFNELMSLAYRMFLKGAYNPQCALLMNKDGVPFILPAPISQTIGFFLAFMFMDMYYNDQFLPATFFCLVAVMMLTIFSRINVGCKSLMDALMTTFIGMMLGVGYYEITKDYYKSDYINLRESEVETKNKEDDFFELD